MSAAPSNSSTSAAASTSTTSSAFPTAATTTLASSSNAPTPSQSPSGGITPAGSELYLFTFLTTLLLLLGVSCAIIIRSLILRRRFRRRVQEAIANGVFIPGMMDRPTRDIGEKPKMWDVWVGMPDDELSFRKTGNSSNISEKSSGWDDVLPVAATKLPAGGANASTPSTPHPLTTPQILPSYDRFFPPLFRFRRNPPAPTVTPSTLEAQTSPRSEAKPQLHSDKQEPEDSQVQLSLLIAMPSAARPTYQPPSSYYSDKRASTSSDPKGKLKAHGHHHSAWDHLDEGEIPHVELGVVELAWRDPDANGNKAKKDE